MKGWRWVWVVCVFSAMLAACFNRAYTADLSARAVNPPTHMVARPIPRTLFIVVSEDNVHDQFRVRNSPHSVRGFRPFLANTLRAAMRPYFQTVHAVAGPPTPDQLAAAGPCAVADVRLDGVEARDMPVGRLVYTTLHIQWAFAIRLAEADEYLFSFAGTGVSENSYHTLDIGFEQLVLSAVTGLMQRWTDDDVFNAVRRASSGGEVVGPPQEI